MTRLPQEQHELQLIYFGTSRNKLVKAVPAESESTVEEINFLKLQLKEKGKLTRL